MVGECLSTEKSRILLQFLNYLGHTDDAFRLELKQNNNKQKNNNGKTMIEQTCGSMSI